MSLNPGWDGYDHSHKLIDHHGRKFQTFAFVHPTREKYDLTFSSGGAFC
jgi:hypothetical protein